MRTENCDFCNEFSGGSENTFGTIYRQQLINRILYRSEHFALMPSVGQIVEGYLLIAPLRHYTAIADIPPEGMRELTQLRDLVRAAVSQSYGPSILFEHGIRGTQAGGCGVEHAHLHVVPFPSSNEPIEKLRTCHFFKSIKGIFDLPQAISPKSPYLYYEQVDGKAWVCEIERIPSQYIRQMLATCVGAESWNWRECGVERKLLSTHRRLSDFFRTQLADVTPGPLARAAALS